MRSYDSINVGDVFASPVPMSNVTFIVVRKVDWLIEMSSSLKHPALSTTFCIKAGDSIFDKRIYNQPLESTTATEPLRNAE